MALLDSPLSCEVDLAQRLVDVLSKSEGLQKLTGLSDPALIKDRHIILCINEPPYVKEGFTKPQLQQEHVLVFIEPPSEEEGHGVRHPAGTRAAWDEEGLLDVTFRQTPADSDTSTEERKQTAYLNFWDCVSKTASEVPPLCWVDGLSGLDFLRVLRPEWVAVEHETTRGLELTCVYQFRWGWEDAGE